MKFFRLQKHLNANPTNSMSGKNPVPFSTYSTFNNTGMNSWYQPVLLGTSTLGNLATSSACLHQVIEIIKCLEADDYINFMLAYCEDGLGRYGERWQYADILTVLLAAAQLVRPQSYLEIGVRRGRSMAMIAATCPSCQIVGFDLWMNHYAGMPNPGPDFVSAEMKQLGYSGQITLIRGNSHETVKNFINENPDKYFDIITVDGDHSKRGAEEDLITVLSRVKIGGVLVFDDISHPNLPYLIDVWYHVLSDSRFTTWEYTDLGYGVAFAIRRCE